MLKYLQQFFPLIMLIFLSLTINNIFDAYFLLGVCLLLEIFFDNGELKGQKPGAVDITDKLLVYKNLLPNMNNYGLYGQAVLNVLFGLFLMVYLIVFAVYVSSWSTSKSNGQNNQYCDQPTNDDKASKFYIYFMLGVVFNLLIIIVIFLIHHKNKHANDQLFTHYSELKRDVVKIHADLKTKKSPNEIQVYGLSKPELAFLNENFILDLRLSISKLKIYVYLFDFTFYLTCFYLGVIILFETLCILVELCSN